MRSILFHIALCVAALTSACHLGQPVAREVSPAAPVTAEASAVAPGYAGTRTPFPPLGDQDALHNGYVVVPDKVLSGAEPDGDRSFQFLQELGVKTIVSVDGARPDVAAARRFGMRYVHLPIGYDDVTADEGKAIAKALGELPGPIYVHCHHGKHRSAAAVAVACVNNGMLQPHQAEDVLKTFGTGENYRGLWRSARQARRVDDRELAQAQIQWVETAQVPALADAMVKIETHWDHLKAIQQAGWATPVDHPDLDPAHEALQVQEHFYEINRMTDTTARSAEYRKLLAAGETSAIALREALSARPIKAKAADAVFKRASISCTACHKSFRD